MRGYSAAAAFLSAAAFACYGGAGIARLGFYHDDWAVLADMYFAPRGFLPAAKALIAAEPKLFYRPLDVLLYAGPFALAGMAPLGWQVWLLLLNAAAGWLVFQVLSQWGVSRRLAGLAGALFIAYPSKDATLYWPCIDVNTFSLVCLLAAYSAHIRYVERGGGAGWASPLLLLGSLASYDQCAFLFLLWPLVPRVPAGGGGERLRRGTLCAAATAAAYFAYKFGVVPRLLGVGYNQTIRLSAGAAARTYLDGTVACLSPALFLVQGRVAFDALRSSPLTTALAAALPWVYAAAAGDVEDGPDSKRLFGLGAAVFILGYLPIAVSGYRVLAQGWMNRVNQVPALGVVVMAAALAGRRRGAAEWGYCAAASLLLAGQVGAAAYWARSWELQMEVKEAVLAVLPRWPEGSKLFVLPPTYVVGRRAPVFAGSWDIAGAARIWTSDPAREADIAANLGHEGGGGRPRDAYLLDVAARRMGRLPP